MQVEFPMRHRGNSASARRVHRAAATGRHRGPSAPPYPWLRVAGTVGLATLVPVTGGWVAVGAIGFDLSDPLSPQQAVGSALRAGTASHAVQAASPSAVLNRSPSPSLQAVATSARRVALSDHRGRMPAPVTVSAGPTTPPEVKHRADRTAESSPTPAVGGRHRADTGDGPVTTRERDDGDQRYPDDGQDQGSGSPDSGSAGPENGAGHGEGHADTHDGGDSNGHGYGHDDDSGAGDGPDGAQAGGQAGGQDGGQAGARGGEHGSDQADGHADGR
jgi:hypothetical protein